MSRSNVYDVIVLGCGPAGSTVGNLVAQGKYSTLVIDKEMFPRFHIGESLLPRNLPVFERLGVVLDQSTFVRKAGAEFINEETSHSAVYPFAEGLPGSIPHAWQVERAAFDHLLLQQAERAGATVHQGETVKDVVFEADAVRVVTDRSAYTARYCVDATGQDAFFGRRERTIAPIKGFGRAAVFCHFEGLSDDITSELEQTGNIKVLIKPWGWMWLIPLSGARLSVGAVSTEGGIKPELLDEAIGGSALIGRLTAGAQRTNPRVIRNFSYKNTASRGSRFVCVGDAACFLDPVFSSGVALAMLGAERVADLLSDALTNGREAEPDLMLDYANYIEVAYRHIGALIHAFYNTQIVQNLFFAVEPDPDMRAGLITLLSGEVWRSDNRFQQLLAQSTRLAGRME